MIGLFLTVGPIGNQWLRKGVTLLELHTERWVQVTKV